MKSFLMSVAIALVVAIIVGIVMMYVTKETVEEVTLADFKKVMQVKTHWFKIKS
jgi:uncharacterized membrane protein (DUF106 family)